MLQELQAAFNADLLKNAKTMGRRFIPSGIYTAQVEEVVGGLLRDGETYKLDLTVQLLTEDLTKAGRAFIEVTPTELTNYKGELRTESALFYALMKLTGTETVPEFVDALQNNFVFSVYGSEYFNARNGAYPEALRQEGVAEDKWVKTYINKGDERKREVLMDAGLKSRFMVTRVGEHRG